MSRGAVRDADAQPRTALEDARQGVAQEEEARQRAREELVGRVEVERTPWSDYKVRGRDVEEDCKIEW